MRPEIERFVDHGNNEIVGTFLGIPLIELTKEELVVVCEFLGKELWERGSIGINPEREGVDRVMNQISGYQPDKSGLDPANPPKCGSGIIRRRLECDRFILVHDVDDGLVGIRVSDIDSFRQYGEDGTTIGFKDRPVLNIGEPLQWVFDHINGV